VANSARDRAAALRFVGSQQCHVETNRAPLPDKFSALSIEIFVREADSWVDTAKGERLTWMGEECSAAHLVDVNLDL